MENMDKGLTLCTKMGADKSAQNLSAQAQKVWNFNKKKASLGVRSPWGKPYVKLSKPNTNKDV